MNNVFILLFPLLNHSKLPTDLSAGCYQPGSTDPCISNCPPCWMEVDKRFECYSRISGKCPSWSGMEDVESRLDGTGKGGTPTTVVDQNSGETMVIGPTSLPGTNNQNAENVVVTTVKVKKIGQKDLDSSTSSYYISDIRTIVIIYWACNY